MLKHRQVSIPEACSSMAQGGAHCLSDPLPFNLWPAPVGAGAWGKPPSWVTKPSPPLPQDGASHSCLPLPPARSAHPFRRRSCWKLRGVHLQLSPQLQGRDGTTLSLTGAGKWHPVPHTLSKPGRAASLELGCGARGAVGSGTPRCCPTPALSGLIRRRISWPCSCSPDLINGPFISTLKESAIFCLLN